MVETLFSRLLAASLFGEVSLTEIRSLALNSISWRHLIVWILYSGVFIGGIIVHSSHDFLGFLNEQVTYGLLLLPFPIHKNQF